MLKNSRWVQSPVWPEVEKLLKKIKISDTYYLRGNNKASGELKSVIELHREWVKSIIDLSEFPHAYVTSGATEAINHWRMTDKRPWQYFKGDYQWPQIISKNGNENKYLNSKEVLYVSNPACSTGNFVSLKNINNPVILDCAYITATAIKKITVPKNTEQVMFSFSKGFGLIGQRCGLVYTKEPHPTLEPLNSVECFNYASSKIMEAMMDNFTVDEMYNKYKGIQKEVCDKYDLIPSDTYFVATSTDPFYKKLRRNENTARLCITGIE